MGTSSKDKKAIKKLMLENEAIKKQMEALGITVDNLEDKIDTLPVDEYANVNKNYEEWKKTGQWHAPVVEPPVACPEHEHWDEAAGKCVPDVVTPPPTGQCEDPNAHYDPTALRCICNTGFHEDATGKCVKDVVTPPPSTGDKDKFGIPYFHKSKVGGLNYEMSDNPKDDSTMDELDDHYTVSGGVITMKPDGPTSLGVGKYVRTYQSDIGGSDMKFSDLEKKGYMYKPDDVRDLEYKCIMKINGLGEHGFSMSSTTGRHSEDPDCRGFAYMFNIEDPSASPVTFRFRKEMWHVSYHNSPEDIWTHPAVPSKLDGADFFGFGFCRYNSPGKTDSVTLEAWICPPGKDFTVASNWVMLKRVEDKPGNNWGNDGDTCGGAKDQVGTWSGPQNRLKTNATGGTVQFKCITFREIDPSLD